MRNWIEESEKKRSTFELEKSELQKHLTKMARISEFLPKPKGWFRKSCPGCSGRLETKYSDVLIENEYVATQYLCKNPSCGYEYVSLQSCFAYD